MMLARAIALQLSSPLMTETALNFGDVSETKLKDDSLIYWGDEPVGKLKKGKTLYKPTIDALNSEYLSSENKLLISAKLQKWYDNELDEILYPLNKNLDENLNPEIRAIAFNCFENYLVATLIPHLKPWELWNPTKEHL